jgi:hypothetical protein
MEVQVLSPAQFIHISMALLSLFLTLRYIDNYMFYDIIYLDVKA